MSLARKSVISRARGTVLLSLLCLALANVSFAQDPQIRFGNEVPREVEQMYARGLDWLASNQNPQGGWDGGQSGPAIVGINLMAFLASGEDPNFGKYRDNVRRAVRSLIRSQNATTGYFGGSMYHHGFAQLGLAEVYGALDESSLWAGEPAGPRRSVAQALELGVRCAVTSQASNPQRAWRYSPEARDADTSVAGAVLMGLLASRNAGIPVPDESIEGALTYFSSMSTAQGEVGYSGPGASGSDNLKGIAVLVFALGKRKNLTQFEPLLKRISATLEHRDQSYPEYNRYYMAQALYQGDVEAWNRWNTATVRHFKSFQSEDGSFTSSYGPAYGTGMALLAMGLNYRFLPIYER